MIKTKTVKLEGKTFVVQEMTLKQLSAFFNMPVESTIIDRINSLLEYCVPGLDDVISYSPSELQMIIDAMLEVNDSFFVQAAALGMQAAAEQLEKVIKGLSIVASSV